MRSVCLAGWMFTCLALWPALAGAAKNANLAPAADRFDKMRFEDRFDRESLDSSWRINKGSWEVADGHLVGREKPTDRHAAVLTLQEPFRSAAIRFSFKLDGLKAFNLSFNHPRGHLFRVIVRENALVIRKDKDKRDPHSRVEELARTAAEFEPGVWHTLLVEIDGGSVTVQADQGASARAENAGLDVDKTGYRFVVQGEAIAIDDVQVWNTKE